MCSCFLRANNPTPFQINTILFSMFYSISSEGLTEERVISPSSLRFYYSQLASPGEKTGDWVLVWQRET